jgi:hypothetical protein
MVEQRIELPEEAKLCDKCGKPDFKPLGEGAVGLNRKRLGSPPPPPKKGRDFKGYAWDYCSPLMGIELRRRDAGDGERSI